MSAHVLLNLLNEPGKSFKMRDLASILSAVFCNEFNKFNLTGARLLDSVFHMTLKTSRICHYLHNVITNGITLLICKPLVVY